MMDQDANDSRKIIVAFCLHSNKLPGSAIPITCRPLASPV
jgi:hypothetical protein